MTKNTKQKHKYWYVEFEGIECYFPVEEYPTKEKLIEKIEDTSGYEVTDENFKILINDYDYEIKIVPMQPSHHDCIEVICPYCKQIITFDKDYYGGYNDIIQSFEIFGSSLVNCPYRKCVYHFLILDEMKVRCINETM